jgi:hypothetical protein
MLTLHFRDGTSAHVAGDRHALNALDPELLGRLERALRRHGKTTRDVRAATIDGRLLPVREAGR